MKFENVIVAIDQEDRTHVLVDRATDFCELVGAKLWVLHVADPEPDFVGYDAGPEYVRLDAALEYREDQRWVQSIAERIKGRKVDAEALLVPGYVAEVILESADRVNADMIICGSHRRKFFLGIFVENTAVTLSKKSERPLMIFPL
ncbi:MAG TPA: universal stress protein [Cryomorphaceae bacterium]|nr:universal stress protein [Cryomorphaceae bacterium]